MRIIVGTCYIDTNIAADFKTMIIKAWECKANGCVTTDKFEHDPLFSCEQCGNEFHRSESADETVPHRCDCGRFAALSEDDLHWTCPVCLDAGPEPRVVHVVAVDGTDDYLEVENVEAVADRPGTHPARLSQLGL